jgi:hypothetical protein
MPVLFIAAADALGRWARAPARGAPARGAPAAGDHGQVAPAAPGRAVSLSRSARAGVARHGGALIAGATVTLALHFPVSGLWQPSTYHVDEAHLAAANAAMAVVPDGATVQATLDLVAPLAARTDTFWISTPNNPLTTYIVFDDVNSGYSAPIANVAGFIALLQPHGGYVQVFERDGVYVFRRGPAGAGTSRSG